MATRPTKQAKFSGAPDVDFEIVNVKEETRAVNAQIEKVESQIEKVEKKLDSSRHDWDNSEDLRETYFSIKEYREHLRREKEQLRRKEEQLRNIALEKLKIARELRSVPEASASVKNFFALLQEIPAPAVSSVLKLPSWPKWTSSENDHLAVFVRRCYLELHEKMFELERAGKKDVIITGTPGIGKSYFALYCLHRAVKEGRSVLVEIGSYSVRKCLFWSPQRVLEGDFNTLLDVIDSGTLVLVDSRRDVDHPRGRLTVAISSPREQNFHDFWKNGALMLFMPLWTEEELEKCREEIYGDKKLPLECMRVAIEYVGRIPRYVLERAAEAIALNKWSEEAARRGKVPDLVWKRLERALLRADESSLRETLTYKGFQVGDLAQSGTSHQLINVDTNDYEREFFVFASRYVQKNLQERFEELIETRAKELERAGEGDPMRATLSGLMFEKFAHRALCTGRCDTQARVLTDKNEPKDFFELPFGQGKFLQSMSYDQNDLAEEFKSDVYYRPTSSTAPSIDSFAIVGNILYLIQITIARRHGIGVRALENIMNRAPCEQCILLFVTKKEQVGLFKAQRFTTKRGKVATRLSREVSDIRQAVVGVEF